MEDSEGVSEMGELPDLELQIPALALFRRSTTPSPPPPPLPPSPEESPPSPGEPPPPPKPPRIPTTSTVNFSATNVYISPLPTPTSSSSNPTNPTAPTPARLRDASRPSGSRRSSSRLSSPRRLSDPRRPSPRRSSSRFSNPRWSPPPPPSRTRSAPYHFPSAGASRIYRLLSPSMMTAPDTEREGSYAERPGPYSRHSGPYMQRSSPYSGYRGSTASEPEVPTNAELLAEALKARRDTLLTGTYVCGVAVLLVMAFCGVALGWWLLRLQGGGK
ncbi:uncharacterized protein K452DRAFT_303936 [Aplosporella prunicola CBS 121167]|uniref:Uncharacterized protein n=1 Tax=Aplosporella prunicola CBS 121167 TaxID=1176127 RepID=A0A6A6BVY3_9PEZI|nr:uncharacterized protein K452DRAFT_303936 [Aplosporella prunicola CBS 121167]KAF2147027.1 hypothetical protein K452DRAFT_303936 [Aplosporella prunicola CBS 121167]